MPDRGQLEEAMAFHLPSRSLLGDQSLHHHEHRSSAAQQTDGPATGNSVSVHVHQGPVIDSSHAVHVVGVPTRYTLSFLI